MIITISIGTFLNLGVNNLAPAAAAVFTKPSNDCFVFRMTFRNDSMHLEAMTDKIRAISHRRLSPLCHYKCLQCTSDFKNTNLYFKILLIKTKRHLFTHVSTKGR